MRLFGSIKPKPTHQEIFLERYDAIVGWVKGLTKNDLDLVEDVVQDAFVQFTLNGPNLDDIENLDGYLYVLVKNLCLTHYRRSSRNRLTQLSVFEYDSVDFAVNKIDYRDREDARDQLQRLLVFLIKRKDTARSGSIFILRFIHGYFPIEIATILGCSRASVDVRLMEARNEIRTYLESDGRKTGQKDDEISKLIFDLLPVETTADQSSFINGLRRAVFRFSVGSHLSKVELEGQKAEGQKYRAIELSHLVSCLECLNQINTSLGFPPLNSRFPTDAIGRDPGVILNQDKGKEDLRSDNVVDIRTKS